MTIIPYRSFSNAYIKKKFKNNLAFRKKLSTDLKINAVLIISFLVLFPMILAWEHLSLEDNICPEPSFALFPQELRNAGNKFSQIEENYENTSAF